MLAQVNCRYLLISSFDVHAGGQDGSGVSVHQLRRRII